MCCKYPVLNLVSCSVRDIKLMENGIGDNWVSMIWVEEYNVETYSSTFYFYSLLFWILSHICFPVIHAVLSEDIFLLLIPVNPLEIIMQLQSTLSKAFWCSVDVLHKFFFSRSHSCDIVCSRSLHTSDSLQHPLCS